MAQSKVEKVASMDSENTNDDKFRLIALLSFMIVVIIIGVPMWWKTTEVYRVTLPYTNIESLGDEGMTLSLAVAIFALDPKRSANLVRELDVQFADDVLWNISFQAITDVDQASTATTPANLEALLLKRRPVRMGDFMLIEWPTLDEDVLLTNKRSAFFNSETSSAKIKSVLNEVVLQSFGIEQILLQNDVDNVGRREAPQLEYDVVVSVLNPRPDIMDAKWNVKSAVDTYIAPLLRQISHVSNFTLKTQWKYQLAFEADLRQIRDDTQIGRHYAMSEESLPHVITSLEKNLGVSITDQSSINLVVYVPPCEISPLHIYRRHNKKATINDVDSFVAPKWGGVIIANPPIETCESYNREPHRASFYINTNDVMQIMVYQLQKLLDIVDNINVDGVKAMEAEQLTPRQWQYESYIRRSAISHIVTASHTLRSLIKLLDNISYIVINDDIGQIINDAYEAILKAKASLEGGDLLDASMWSKRAFVLSERAFFDSTLLAQLYFPDEQKYAIYVPLFLPILVPVFASFSSIRRLYMKVKTVRKEKTH